jgi:hypothetical protein
MYQVKDLKVKGFLSDEESTIRVHISELANVEDNTIYYNGGHYDIIEEGTTIDTYNVKVFRGGFDGDLAKCCNQRDKMLKFVSSGINPERYDSNRTDKYEFMTKDEIIAEVKAGNWVAVKDVGLLEEESDLAKLS